MQWTKPNPGDLERKLRSIREKKAAATGGESKPGDLERKLRSIREKKAAEDDNTVPPRKRQDTLVPDLAAATGGEGRQPATSSTEHRTPTHVDPTTAAQLAAYR